MKHSLITWFLAPAILLVVLPFSAFARTPDSNLTPAKPTESKDRTYRTVGGRSVIAIVSSDELEMRQGGDNIVCKYTENDGKLRVIVNMLGTTTAKYFNLTPQGLVDEDGEVFYEPETFQKITVQIQLNTELVEAVERDDAVGIDALVAKGAMVESRDNRGTALLIAINGGLTNAVSALLKNGANPNQKAEGDGKTPLMSAAGWQGGWGGMSRKPEHDTIVSMLCGAKADLNAIDKNGNTALAQSLMNNNLEATRILVDAGADRAIKNNDGSDAFALAAGDSNKTDALHPFAGIIDGVLVSHGEYRSAYLSTYLAQALSQGSEITPKSENEALLHRLAWKRLATMREAIKLGISATDDELKGAIHSNFAETNGASNSPRYQEFLQNIIRPMGYSDAQFEQHLREEITIQKLASQIGKQAQVSPIEVRQTFNTLMDSYLVEYAILHAPDILQEGDMPDGNKHNNVEADLAAKALAIREAVTAGLADGKSFEQSVAGLGVEVSVAEPFTGLSGSSSTNLVVRALAQAVANHKQGELSDPVPIDEGLVVAYLKTRAPADPSTFDAYQPEIASAMLNRRAQAHFRDWQEALLVPGRFTDFQLADEASIGKQKEGGNPQNLVKLVCPRCNNDQATMKACSLCGGLGYIWVDKSKYE